MSDFFICVIGGIVLATMLACVNVASKWAKEARKAGAIK